MALPQTTGEFRAVADPELRFTPAGKQVANVRLAASRRKKDQSGNWEDAEQAFINASVWDQDAEQLVESVQKGDLVIATGGLHTRNYERQDGTKGTSVELAFSKVALLRKKGAAQRNSGGAQAAPANDPWATSASQQNAQQQQSDPWSNNQQQIDEPPF